SLILRPALVVLAALLLMGSSCNDDDPEVLPPEDVLACGVIEKLVAETSEPVASLFRSRDGACEAVPASALDSQPTAELFADQACTQAVPFRGMSFTEFCGFQLLGNARTRNYVGHPPAWIDARPDVTDRIETPWSLARETTLQVAALDQTEQPRPYVQRVEFRRVDGCSLGMRVYVPRLGADDLRPAMVLHGGGWRFRGAGAAAGIGIIAPQLTARGYAVFAPFHRLTGDSDGPASCGSANGRAIVADVEAALDWVLTHGSDYGVAADATSVAVVGQSSGAHLATWLAVHRTEQVRRALLLYPLTDVPFLVRQLGEGGIFAGRFERGQRLLLAYMDEPGVAVASGLTPDADFAVRNSFVSQIAADPDAFPDFDIVHGDADAEIPVELSVRLCQSKNPSGSLSEEAWPGGDADLTCGGGHATIVAGASHALDLRCFSGEKAPILALLNDDLGGLCNAGSPAQESRVREALRAAFDRF
ncbi:MAG: alpha/beta hydrolase, partial [Thermoanaerobaculia bacterium]|nr:alpha/beta hydrolase [Thermoanaerobaculia bacterium]